MTQEELARRAEMPQSQVSLIIKGEKGASWETIVRLAQVTGLDLNALAGLTYVGIDPIPSLMREMALPGGRRQRFTVRLLGPIEISIDEGSVS